jgi:hypothetical protein
MWTYRIETGALLENGANRGTGYSGFGNGKNNVELVAMPNVGPIPPGKYRIGPAYHHDHLGPVTMNLDPLPGTDTHGRSLFRIHGENATHTASHGCVILARPLREAINVSRDRILQVTE